MDMPMYGYPVPSNIYIYYIKATYKGGSNDVFTSATWTNFAITSARCTGVGRFRTTYWIHCESPLKSETERSKTGLSSRVPFSAYVLKSWNYPSNNSGFFINIYFSVDIDASCAVQQALYYCVAFISIIPHLQVCTSFTIAFATILI